jgi:hypothetical protein
VQNEQLPAVTTYSISSARQSFSLKHPRARNPSPTRIQPLIYTPTSRLPSTHPLSSPRPSNQPIHTIPNLFSHPHHIPHTPAFLPCLHTPLHSSNPNFPTSPCIAMSRYYLHTACTAVESQTSYHIPSQGHLSFPSTHSSTALRSSKPRVRGSTFSRHRPARGLVRSDWTPLRRWTGIKRLPRHVTWTMQATARRLSRAVPQVCQVLYRVESNRGIVVCKHG